MPRWSARITLGGDQVRLRTAANSGADGRSAKNAAAPLKQSREAHRSARPLHSPEGGLAGRVFERTVGLNQVPDGSQAGVA